jgi:hypothetical protein
VNLFWFIPGYESAVYDAGKEPLLFLFLAFIIAFGLTRLYTRVARAKGWGSGKVGGVHMHHMVPGIILMVVCGIFGFSTLTDGQIAYDIVAIGFGVGAALTLDEFAMVFHLRDVYWAKEGRTSIDALFMGVALAGLLLVASSPFGLNAETRKDGLVSVFLVLTVNVSFAVVTFLKKKPLLGIVAVLVPFLGAISAIRLAKPDSPWARWFYAAGRARKDRARARRDHKLYCATWRFTQGWPGRFEHWFSDLVGGAPSPVLDIGPSLESEETPNLELHNRS